ncbi:hypothetical protein DCAR_0311796 [Daucus carota subsp. sativus]|uniref:Fatty acyl-CoA reductase n=1 Tax=Daucus carota subsp. sativus TaxID=79200 RepID=A0A166APV7_DAUCS|nr:PREDICTED: fatty acyl-CoA reductase 3 [Daucus carota subsp. sativus]WOG92526.1 hypothetical protein DCAR_0311796 [Daucus carota subsp. sativus]
MELGSIVQFLENRTILVTGATGFLAKIFVEKILRAQPNVKKLYLLLRAPDSKAALQRLNTEILAKELFRVLKERLGSDLYTHLSKRVTPVAGDITHENLGVKDSAMLQEMCREVDIVVNIAATTNFDERYDISLALNTFGAEHVYNFAMKCSKIKLLLHVSTAYVCGEKTGLIVEDPYKMGETLNGERGLDVNHEKQVIEEALFQLNQQNATNEAITAAMKELGIQRARHYGWPNTYVFTKAMGEMLLGEMNLNKQLPLVIVRPTIITSTYEEPFPGWVEGIRTVDSLAVGYGKGKLTCFLGDPDSNIDLIPADMVVNTMIVAMAAHSNEPECEVIYHVGSSFSNPVKYNDVKNFGRFYFTRTPWINKDGKAVKVGDVTVLSSMPSFRRYMAIRYLLPLKGLQLVNIGLCQLLQEKYVDLSRKVKYVLRMVELYEPYLFFKGVFDDMNTEKLRKAAEESSDAETDVFYFDPKCIDWEDYFVNTHLAGLVKYVLK